MADRTTEQDFPKGHPARFDFDPASPEAVEWKRKNVHPLGERDFPVDHPKASDTPGNLNSIEWRAGIDPFATHLQEHTGRTPAQVAELAQHSKIASVPPANPLALPPVDAAVANAALQAKREELGVEALSAEQTAEVLAALQNAAQNKGA